VKSLFPLKAVEGEMVVFRGLGEVRPLGGCLGLADLPPGTVSQIDESVLVVGAVDEGNRPLERVVVMLQNRIDVVTLEERHPVLPTVESD